MPLILWKVQKSITGASHVQLRVPMGIGIFLIPFFTFRNRSKYIFWVKYANNWGSYHVPIGYRIQRWFLKKNILNSKVTINGTWPNQPRQCISFENPCLTENQISEGNKIIQSKIKVSSSKNHRKEYMMMSMIPSLFSWLFKSFFILIIFLFLITNINEYQQ
jgi:hypothetical protein